jgi:hypothetical protein
MSEPTQAVGAPLERQVRPDVPEACFGKMPQGAVYTRALGTVGAAMYTYTADQMRAYAAQAVEAERNRGTALRTVAVQVLRDMQAQGVLLEWQTLLDEALRA